MSPRYVHTNLVARDWRKLAAFYVHVFGCTRVEPERDLSGEWLERGTRVPGAHLRGQHLRLPGHGEGGPSLEIFEYDSLEEQALPVANRVGFGHIAFSVDDVKAALDQVIGAGGSAYGEIVTRHIEGVGELTFTYVRDPEGNLIELQTWR